MLNQRRGIRAFSVILVAVMLFAAVLAITNFASSDKSNGEVLLGSLETGNIQLSSTEHVDTKVIYENEDIFNFLEIKQTDIKCINIIGQVDLAKYADVVSGDIGVRIGEDAVKSHIMNLAVDSNGNFELDFVLNSVFCSIYDNKVPVIVSYAKASDAGVINEIQSVLGVFTYDYDAGILRYPEGAEYIREDGAPVRLTTFYVPADIKRGDDGEVTVTYQDTMLTFVANDVLVADAPYGYIGAIDDVNGSDIVLKTVAGLEYGYIKVDASVSSDYGKITNWQLADGDSLTFEGLTPGVLYTIWVRTPASDGVLPSAPILVTMKNTLTSAQDYAKKAFLNKYADVVVNGDELYSTSDPIVKADADDIAYLITLYDSLGDDVKALDDISEKGKYLVLSHYLAKYQTLLAAVEAADSYADLRADFTYNDMLMACEDFTDVASEIAAHLFDDNDGWFVLNLSFKVQKTTVLLPIASPNVDAAADLKYKAVAYSYGLYVGDWEDNFAEYDEDLRKSDYNFGMIPSLQLARDEYEFVLFCKKYERELSGDNATIAMLEAMLADFVEVDFFTPEGNTVIEPQMFDALNVQLAELYSQELEELLSKYDPTADNDIYNDIHNVLSSIKRFDPANPDSAPTYGEYPETKEIYHSVLHRSTLYDAYVDACRELDALAVGKADNVVSVINGYRNAVYDLYNNSIGSYPGSSDKDAFVNTYVATIQLEVTKAKAHVAFFDKKDSAKAEINALKDTNPAVIAAADKYLPGIDIISFNYSNAATLNADIDAIVAAAKAETDFEKKRAEVKSNLEKDVASKKASGKYSVNQIAQLDSYLAEAIAIVNNYDYVAGKTTADLEAQQAESIAKFATVNVISVSAGDVPVFGDMSVAEYPNGYDFSNGYWGNVTNSNGFGSALELSIKKVGGKSDFKADKVVLASGELTEAETIAAVEDKVVLLKFDITLSDGSSVFTGDNNGLYTVRILIPEEYRDTKGLYVVSQSGDTTYVYETNREGNYLVFKVSHFSEFLVVCDKVVNLLWIIIVLAVLFAIEIGIVVLFITKTKKNVAAAVAFPFLAMIYLPNGVIATIIILGALTVIGAGASVFTVYNYKKAAKAESAEKADESIDSAEAAADDAAADTQTAPVVNEEKSEQEFEAESQAEPVVEAAPEPQVEPVVEAEAEPQVEPVVEAEPEPQVEPVIVPVVVCESEEDETNGDDQNQEPLVEKASSENSVVVPIVIAGGTEDETEDSAVTVVDESDEEETEDKKVYSAFDGARVYVTYDYSFRSKLMLSSEDVQSRYAIISDTLLSYGLKCRESWKKERYFAKNKTYANIIFRGRTLCVCLAIVPESLEGTKYFYENVGNVKKYETVPVMIRVRSARGCKYALELIKMMLEGAGFIQQRPVTDKFTYCTEDKDALIEKGLIKVLMTDGDGEAITADFDAMKNMKFSLSAGMPILKRVTVEEAAAIPDSEVENFIETEVVEEENGVYGRRKGIINIDTISDAYSDGDTVTLQNLIAKKLVAKNIGSIKILARGALDKALTVKANDFSIDAAKMIVIAGGSVIKLKDQK